MILRMKDVLFMMILFLIWPEQVYRFSSRKQLPEKGKRRKRNSGKVLPPFEVDVSIAKDIEKVEEINLVMRGRSFNHKDLNKIAEPIYLVSIIHPFVRKRFLEHLSTDEKKLIFVYPSVKHVYKMLEEGLNCIWIDCKEEDPKGNRENTDIMNDEEYVLSNAAYIPAVKNLFPTLPRPDSWAPTGSGLVAIGALFPFAEKMNIYGWDFHLNSSPGKMNYWQLFLNTYDYQCDTRSRNHFESMMVNLYYGYHISKLPNVTVHGYLGQLERHKKMIDRIERVLFD